MAKRPKHEGKPFPFTDPTDETIRTVRQSADVLAEEVRIMKELANEHAEKAKKRLDRIVARDDAQRGDPKRKP